MGHQLTALITTPSVLEYFACQNGLLKPIALSQELAMLPLSADTLDFLLPSLGKEVNGFVYLGTSVLDLLKVLSEGAMVAYIETEYFGGAGRQGAVVCDKGSQVYIGWNESDSSDPEIWPINRALKLLGVKKEHSDFDEFDALRLSQYRRTEDWIQRVAADNCG